MSDDAPQSAPTMLGPGAPSGPASAASSAASSTPNVIPGGDLPAGYVVGEYRIEKVLGRGGMGTVYAGVQPVIEKHVAIKLLNAQFSADENLVRRFVDEARAVNRIRHANIIDIFSFGQIADGRQYFVMEYLEGKTLAERMEKGDLTGDEMPTFLVQICDALDAAHGESIVHRDLKPENVWIVTPKRGKPFVKLLDFGIAKLLSSGERSTTQTGMVMGTPHYMSPEQCHGKAVDHRTDIYAMGVMLYQLYSGRLPFSGETFAEILAKQIIDTPPPPSKYAQIPAELDKLIMKCLAKDPAGRPQSAKELGQLLGSILAGAAARVQRAAGQPTSATTLSASAIEVRRRERETEVAPRKSGKRTAVIGTSIGVGVALAIGVAVVAGRGHAPAPQAAAVAAPQAPAPVAAPPAAPPAPAPVAPPPAPVPPAEAPTATDVDAAKKHHAGKPGRRDDPSAPSRPRSRASDTGLVTHNPFE
ncbi:MAG TPA: serine/threonine-protein kinase [Polyangia bacterium]|nr:serine/threonine-protein kinase [Polyangia bacterium]